MRIIYKKVLTITKNVSIMCITDIVIGGVDLIQKNIELIREAKGVTQKAVANYLGISQMSYWRFEKGKTKKIEPAMLQQIGEFLGVDFQVFFNDKLTESVIKAKQLTKVGG